MVKVKCPKCRLTFEVETLPGITEVACNCPRCGTPFTWQTQDDSPSAQKDGGDPAVPPVRKPATTEGGASSPGCPSSTPASIGEEIHHYNTRSRQTPPSQRPPSYQGKGKAPSGSVPPKRSWGCVKGCLLAFVVGFLLVSLVMRQCSKDEDGRYEAERFENVGEGAADDDVEVGQGGKDTFVEVDAKEAPAWIQGGWAYDDTGEDGLGKVIISIRGNRLTETIQGQNSAEGTFYYADGVLHFESDNGEGRYDYRLDPDKERIEWQDGKFMEKIR